MAPQALKQYPGTLANQTQSRELRLKRLAESIDALVEKDAHSLRRSREMSALRTQAIAELYGICFAFVRALNDLLSRGEVILDPVEFAVEAFDDSAANT